ncbi:MAG: hypothetical protein WC833_02630 [Bacteroidales bacterium]|jgi:hypothetical protein
MKCLNCWEYFECGREPGGVNIEELGVCPATNSDDFKGVNNGKCGGRFCWVVAGTFCKGEVQGTHAKKLKDCIDCPFLKYVNEEEGREFILNKPNQNKNHL